MKPLKSIAYHEAGHAVGACLARKRFENVTIVPDEDSMGKVTHSPWKNFHPDYKTDHKTTSRVKEAIFMILSGPVAESLFTKKKKLTGRANDFQEAFGIASHLFGSVETTEAYVNFMWEQTKNIIQLNRGAVKAVATALLERKTLKYLEVRRIVQSPRKSLIPVNLV
jgi:ATP-dependent Zn protease